MRRISPEDLRVGDAVTVMPAREGGWVKETVMVRSPFGRRAPTDILAVMGREIPSVRVYVPRTEAVKGRVA